MSTVRRAPLPLRIAVRMLPEDAREEVLGDLLEAMNARAAADGRAAARRWAWRQPWATLVLRMQYAHGSERDASFRWRWRTRSLGRVPRGLGVSWLDVKLGIRMLGKQPTLTVVAGLALGLGIPASLIPVHVAGIYVTSFPVEEGDRIVGIRDWDLEANRPVVRLLHDFAVWRAELSSFEVLGAARSDPWNVHSPDGRAEEIRGAEVTASVFTMLRVTPLLGRPLVSDDEVEGAADVVVLSQDVWAARFARDPDIVGKVIGIGARPHTVVGIMPAGFHFPMNDDLWLPLRADPTDYEIGQGPDLHVFGRLAEGASRDEAEAELQTVGARLASEWPETHARRRSEIVSIGALTLGAPGNLSNETELLMVQVLSLALLFVACGNVGVLILARTAMRLSEISIRTALGASRARILAQLFVEALVLVLLATGAGLMVANGLAAHLEAGVFAGEIPYWFDLGLGARSVLLALGLAVVCAVLAGVLPAVRATGRSVEASLRRTTGGATVRFGVFASLLIVAEVALSVGFLALGTMAVSSVAVDRTDQAAIDLDRYLTVRFRTRWVDPTADEAEGYAEAFRNKVAENQTELRDRLAADPSVRSVVMGETLPGYRHQERFVEVEGRPIVDLRDARRTALARVHVDFFRDLGRPILSGRDFVSSDVEGAPEVRPTAVIVNQQFARDIVGGGDVVGVRIRYASDAPPEEDDWLEIVGVVETFGVNVTNPERSAGVYHPVGAADVHPMRYLVEIGDDPMGFMPRLREIADAIDADAMIQRPESLDAMVAGMQREDAIWSVSIWLLALMGALLAATGLYAVMSFTVAQRRREIGIRSALGAGPRTVVYAIGRRCALQLSLGVAIGTALGWWNLSYIVDEYAGLPIPVTLGVVAILVTLVSVAACLPPTLRGLRIQPTEALEEA